MKRIFLILLSVFCLQSCFYTHRARRVEIYEIEKPKREEEVSTMVFEYIGSHRGIELRSMKFFNLDTDYLPFNFKTGVLYGGESLNIYLYTSKDEDKILNLFSIVWNSLFYKDDYNDTPQQKIDNAKDQMELTSKEKHTYIHVQVTDKEGNDVLAEKSMRNKAVMQKLYQYQRLIN